MLPMAIGGPGEEQNAVLARAVIGGVLVGTATTLLFVPYLYSVFGLFERTAARGKRGAAVMPGLSHEGLRS
jgi:Cu/Ag efflux pump CusA